jgi:hypothetical protein
MERTDKRFVPADPGEHERAGRDTGEPEGEQA